MRILIFGLPGSGKTTLAKELTAHLPCLYLNGDAVRALFNDQNFSADARVVQAKRMRALADMFQGGLVIADFVCPTEETRNIFAPDVSIWMNTITECSFSDTQKIFEPPCDVDIVVTTKDSSLHAIRIIKTIKQWVKEHETHD